MTNKERKDRMAPDGQIWVCGACGKTAEDRYGIEGEHSRGWDESCMLHAVLCYDKLTDGRWEAVNDRT